MADQYQLTAECAYVTVDTATGRAKTLLYRGAFIAADSPELKHLLSVGMVEQVGKGASSGFNAEGGLGEATRSTDGPDSVVAPTLLTAEQEAERGAAAQADAETDRKRAAAKAKLPADGSAPHANAGQDVWVEYAVSKGLSREESEKASKDDLKAALAPK